MPFKPNYESRIDSRNKICFTDRLSFFEETERNKKKRKKNEEDNVYKDKNKNRPFEYNIRADIDERN